MRRVYMAIAVGTGEGKDATFAYKVGETYIFEGPAKEVVKFFMNLDADRVYAVRFRYICDRNKLPVIGSEERKELLTRIKGMREEIETGAKAQ